MPSQWVHLCLIPLFLWLLILVHLIIWLDNWIFSHLILHILSPDKVKIADGAFSFDSGKCLVHTTHSFSLSSVLYAPSFAENLLSISRITLDLNCSITFFPSSYVFQDLQTRMANDIGMEINGLYFLNLLAPTQGQLSVAYHTFISPSAEETIWL